MSATPYFGDNTLRRWAVLFHLGVWLSALLLIRWLQPLWQLSGPHGHYPWVGMDFAPYWVGAREALHGHSPYSATTLRHIQQVVYGGPAGGEDPMMFMYPAWVIVLVAPLTILPYSWAVAVYTATLLWAMLVMLIALAPPSFKTTPSRFALWLVLILAGSLPFLVISVVKGQLGYWSLVALFLAYRAWQHHRDGQTGVWLALALLKPTTVLLPTAGVLLFALLRKRWRVFAGFAAVLTALLGLSFWMAGNWLPDYLHVLSIKGGRPVLWSVTTLPFPWNVLWGLFFLGVLARATWYALHVGDDTWFPAFVLAGMALTPMRWIYDLFVGVLLLAEYTAPPAGWRDGLVGVALLAPWLGVFLPAAWRWPALLIGLPLVWSVVGLAVVFPGAVASVGRVFRPPHQEVRFL